MFEESITSIPSIWASMNSWFTPTVLFLFLNLMIGTIYITSSLATTHHHKQQPTAADSQNHQQFARSPSVLQRLKSINFHTYRSPEPTTVTIEKSHQFDTHFTFQQSPQEEYHQNQPFLSRSPSMLQRIKSINLYNYFSQEPIVSNVPKSQETVTNTHFSFPTPQKIYQPQQEQLVQEEVETEEEEVEEEEEIEKIQDQEQTLDEIYSKLQSNNKVNRSNSDTKPSGGEIPTKLAKKMKKSASSKSAFAHFEENDIVETRRPATMKEGKTNKMVDVDDAEVDAKADDFINRFKQQLKLLRINFIIKYKEMIHRGNGN